MRVPLPTRWLAAGLLAAGLTAAVGAEVPPLLRIDAPPRLAPLAEQLRRSVAARLGLTLRLVGLERPGESIAVVLAGEDSAAARGVPPWIAGYAYPSSGRIVLLVERPPSYPDGSLAEVLQHELAHVLIARAAGDRPLPRWFQEGLAMVAAGEWGLADRSRLLLAVVRDPDLSLAELDARFAGDRATSAGAYAVAGALVNDLLQRFGAQSAAAMLSGVALGLPFDAAFERATGTALPVALGEFWRRHDLWYRWVPFLTSSVTLWIGVTLLALAAIRRRRQRDALLRRRWEEEEALLSRVASPRPWAAERRNGEGENQDEALPGAERPF